MRPETWNQALDSYRIAQQAAGRAPGTIALARHYLDLLRAVVALPWAATTADLRTVLANPTWAPETRKSCRTAFRGFYRWGHGSGYIATDPAGDLETVRVPPGRARPTPEHLVRQLLRHPDPRVGLMAMLAALAGLRCAEIARVHAADLVGDELIVHGKGGRIRAVPIIDPRLLSRLAGLDGWAFPNGLGGHLSPGHVSRMVSRALPEGWTAHTLRHRYASAAYAGTRDLLAVGALLGHTRPETTQRYVAMPDGALRAAATLASRVGA